VPDEKKIESEVVKGAKISTVPADELANQFAISV